MVGEGSGKMSPARLIELYGLATPSGITLLHAMRVDQAASFCTCASHASVRSLLGAAIEDECDVALVDMEAGIEHLARSGGTLAFADVLLMVMEPTRKSVVTAARTRTLAHELGIPRVAGVGNKAHSEADGEFFEAVCEEFGVPLAGVVPFHPGVSIADRMGCRVELPASGPVRDAIETIVDFVDSPEDLRAALEAEKARIERRLAELAAR